MKVHISETTKQLLEGGEGYIIKERMTIEVKVRKCHLNAIKNIHYR